MNYQNSNIIEKCQYTICKIYSENGKKSTTIQTKN